MVLRSLNLLEVGVEFVQQSRAVLTLPLTKIAANQPSVKYVINNGPGIIQEAFNHSSALILEQSKAQYDSMVRWL